MRYLCGETVVPRAEAEELRTRFLLADLAGWEEHDTADVSLLGEVRAVDESLAPARQDLSGTIRFVFYCPIANGVEERCAVLETASVWPVTWSHVDDEDWAHAWKRFWKPQRIGTHLVVRPSWETYVAEPGDVVLELDPGMAFGTGTHATTRMCMEWLESLLKGGENVLDVGTGSGILSLVALKLGASHVLAVDVDPVAVRTASENLTRNGVAEHAFVTQADGLAALDRAMRYDVVVANIVADAILHLLADRASQGTGIVGFLAEGGSFVASGIILERVADVRTGLDEAGLTTQTWRTDGEWASVCARRPA